jgi:hypothetical protein
MKLMLAASGAAVLALGGCDRLAQQSLPSAVTVRLPPPRTPAPGFAFGGGQKSTAPAQVPLR